MIHFNRVIDISLVHEILIDLGTFDKKDSLKYKCLINFHKILIPLKRIMVQEIYDVDFIFWLYSADIPWLTRCLGSQNKNIK